MPIIHLFIYTLCFILVHYLYCRFHRQQTPIKRTTLVAYGILSFILTITIMRAIPLFHMSQSTTLIPYHALWGFLGITFLLWGLWNVLYPYLTAKLVRVPKINQIPFWLKCLKCFLIILSTLLISFSSWFKNFFGQLTAEQFLFNLQSPMTGTADGMSMAVWYGPIFSILTVTIIALFIIFSKNRIQIRKKSMKLSKKTRQITTFIAYTSLLAVSLAYTTYALNLEQIFKAFYTHSSYIEKNYVDIRQTNPRFPSKKRNLIHIYLESVENSYFDKTMGGFMKQNLMPELAEIAKEGTVFSHNQKELGGPYQTYGSSWSVASMINMSSGIPLKVATGSNDYGKSGHFLPGIYNIGDLLHDNGYTQTVMFGADADFGGLTTFFTEHGNFKIFDHKYARQTGLIPQDYAVWWGFEDDKLFAYAKQELTRLSQTNQPFHFMMETADTHFPDGYMTPKTPKKFKSQYANVIAHSSTQVSQFVRWIQKQPFYENTTVVITGDHLSMDAEFFKTYAPNYRRSIFNVILNAPIQTTNTHNRQFSPLDFYPTILASIGVNFDGNRVGLGTNLYSNEPTLIERDGIGMFNNELSKNSTFYQEQFLENHHKTGGYKP